MTRALRAEWCKIWTVGGTGRQLLAIIATTAALGAVADSAVSCPAGGCRLDPARTSLTGIYLSQAVVVIFAVSAISGEYGTGMIRLTFSAMPRRTTVLAAKAAVTTGLTLAAGALAVLAAVLAGRLILPGHGLTLPLGDEKVLRAAAGSVLYLALIALLSLGIAAAVRDTAIAVGTVLGLLYVLPIVTSTFGTSHVAHHLRQLAPMTAGLAVQATTDLRSQPIAPWPGLGVLAGWAAATLLAGGVVLRIRDA